MCSDKLAARPSLKQDPANAETWGIETDGVEVCRNEPREGAEAFRRTRASNHSATGLV
jgi:hypothetical protein